jgi:hypothetical protein
VLRDPVWKIGAGPRAGQRRDQDALPR